MGIIFKILIHGNLADTVGIIGRNLHIIPICLLVNSIFIYPESYKPPGKPSAVIGICVDFDIINESFNLISFDLYTDAPFVVEKLFFCESVDSCVGKLRIRAAGIDMAPHQWVITVVSIDCPHEIAVCASIGKHHRCRIADQRHIRLDGITERCATLGRRRLDPLRPAPA